MSLAVPSADFLCAHREQQGARGGQAGLTAESPPSPPPRQPRSSQAANSTATQPGPDTPPSTPCQETGKPPMATSARGHLRRTPAPVLGTPVPLPYALTP